MNIYLLDEDWRCFDDERSMRKYISRNCIYIYTHTLYTRFMHLYGTIFSYESRTLISRQYF